MVRKYAAIMSLLGMLVVLSRAIKNGAGFDGTMISALVWTVIFGVLGAVLAFIAQQTVDESVRVKIEADLAAIEEAEPTQPMTA